MRLTILVCGLVLISSPLFGQQSGIMLEAPPQPVIMQSAPRVASQAGQPAQEQVDSQLNRQVNVTQQLLQQEEARLQSQFAKLQQMRAAALKKQDKKELDRIERLEQQVVADYQKRVEQVLVSAQTQIQATPIHVQASQPQQQPTKGYRREVETNAIAVSSDTAEHVPVKQRPVQPSPIDGSREDSKPAEEHEFPLPQV